MNIKLKEITVAELVKGCTDNKREGVVDFGGRLDISQSINENPCTKMTSETLLLMLLQRVSPH